MNIATNEYSEARRLLLKGAGVAALVGLGVIPFDVPRALAAANDNLWRRTAAVAGVAVARIVPTAFFRYSTVMPLGIQRIDAGMLTSVVSPPISSARLHSAIACTVLRWLCTRRRLGITSSA